ncbi:MAG TPA: DUF1559 domain-containing protein [Pirellulales bacterium]|nr:DUF1559 domain-containing protein [Pirellulales bacterium]
MFAPSSPRTDLDGQKLITAYGSADLAEARSPVAGSRRGLLIARPSAFTLVELLVVIAIIGILIALLLPAVQAARESARRLQCSDNLKQMGIACQTYATAKRTFPPGKTIIQTNNTTGINFYSNWAIEILPFIEETPLYRMYHFDLQNNDTTFNNKVVQTDVKVYDCPSDPNPPAIGTPQPDQTHQYAKGSYRGVAGRGIGDNGGGNNNDFWDSGQLIIGGNELTLADKGPLPVVVQSTTASPLNPNYSFLRSAVKISQITDGTSKTLLIGEYTTVTQPAPVGGVIVWRSAFWGASYYGLNLGSITLVSSYRTGKNMNPMSVQFDPDYDKCVIDVTAAYSTLGVSARTDQPCNRAFTGVHGGLSGGVMNFVFCDGSVKSVSQLADIVLISNLATIAGGEANQTLP